MNIYEELNRDFFIMQMNGAGFIYYVPKKKMAKVKKEIAEKLQQCQENRENISTEIIELVNIIKHQMSNEGVEIIGNSDNKYIKKLELVVSTICNLNCIYCYANGGTYNCEEKIMPYTVVDSLIRYLKKSNTKIGMIQFFGGEPILGYKTISRICHEIAENDISVEHYSMVSNFTFLPEEFIEDIIKYDIEITVSVDGPPEITNEQRVSKNGNIDVYNTVKENINRLRNKGKDIKAIECTCTDLYQKKGYTKELLEKYLQDEFEIENIVIEDASYQINKKTEKEVVTFFKGEKYTVEEGLLLGYLFDTQKRNSIFCGAGENVFAIFPDGSIYPCHMFALQKEEYCLGNVADDEWDKNKRYETTMDIIRGIKNGYKCGECNARNFCSQCLALTVLNNEKIQCDERRGEFSKTMTNYLRNRCIIHI